jgi:hypothetical protein
MHFRRRGCRYKILTWCCCFSFHSVPRCLTEERLPQVSRQQKPPPWKCDFWDWLFSLQRAGRLGSTIVNLSVPGEFSIKRRGDECEAIQVWERVYSRFPRLITAWWTTHRAPFLLCRKSYANTAFYTKHDGSTFVTVSTWRGIFSPRGDWRKMGAASLFWKKMCFWKQTNPLVSCRRALRRTWWRRTLRDETVKRSTL